MDDLIAFVRAQLDEDERVAQAAGDHGDPGWLLDAHGHVASVEGWTVAEVPVVDAAAEHIARWDPARVVAEVEAKRRVVDDCEDSVKHSGITWPLGRRVLRLLAQPYAGRDGWREEWRC